MNWQLRLADPRRSSRLSLLAALPFLASSAAWARSPGQPFQVDAGETPISVQLHIHGSLSEQNGSMEWHAEKAHEVGCNVIWWTDHDWRTDVYHYTQRYDFEQCVWDPTYHRFTEPDLFDEAWWEYRYAVPASSAAVVDTMAYEGAKSFRLQVTDVVNDGTFAPLDLAQTGTRKQQQYSLATRPHVHFAFRPEQFDPANDKFVVQVRLSEHPTSWPSLRYVIGTLAGEDSTAIPLACTVGQWNTYELDITGDAMARFSMGGADSIRAQDNSMYEFHIALQTRWGHTARAFFDDLEYSSDPILKSDALMDWQRRAGAYYETQIQDVHHLVGTEVSRFRAQNHMNAYAPHLQLIDYGSHVFGDSLYYVVDQVHAQNGLVSYNHPWGIGIYGDLNETPQHKALRILDAKQGLLGNRMYGCDLLEVGYRARMGINLAGHMDLWDCLNANEVFSTGLGVTDTHGSSWSIGWAPWQPNAFYENNYLTWVWATGTSEVPMLKGLGSGRCYFGDPYRWNASMDLVTTDGFPMGRVVLTDKSSHDVIFQVTNVPDDVEVRLKQAEIRRNQGIAYTTVNWLREETITGNVTNHVFTDTVTVDTTLPTFVRFEVWHQGEEWAFSNPIHFERSVPPGGIMARRLGASLASLRIRSADALLLRNAVFDANVPQLTLQLDEATAGLGVLDLDVTAYGPPTIVTGVASWTYDAGILTLSGFSGNGSNVVLGWPASVAAPAVSGSVIREVSLSTGRPNPFGTGLAIELAVPHSCQALVEVMDVQGRRIRVLRDDWTEAGRHRVEWDGRDSFGRNVADGVYFVRLRALGSVITKKAVKVH
ncbi:MAG: T9SS type A sorting domain-containing protein [bacterium]